MDKVANSELGNIITTPDCMWSDMVQHVIPDWLLGFLEDKRLQCTIVVNPSRNRSTRGLYLNDWLFSREEASIQGRHSWGFYSGEGFIGIGALVTWDRWSPILAVLEKRALLPKDDDHGLHV